MLQFQELKDRQRAERERLEDAYENAKRDLQEHRDERDRSLEEKHQQKLEAERAKEKPMP